MLDSIRTLTFDRTLRSGGSICGTFNGNVGIIILLCALIMPVSALSLNAKAA